jgi:lipid A disaccharide synthetase
VDNEKQDLGAIRTQAAIREIEAQRAAVADTLGSRAAELAGMNAMLVAHNQTLSARVQELEAQLAKRKRTKVVEIKEAKSA